MSKRALFSEENGALFAFLWLIVRPQDKNEATDAME